MAEIARRATGKGNRVLFLVHRQEIVNQVISTFEADGVDMELADIGMVQTISRRLEHLEKPTIIFIDEAHHALAKSYRNVLDAFPQSTKLLFTGTPVRLNGDGFEDVADDLILGKSIKWLTEHGNIAPFRYFSPQLIDTSKLKKNSTGDYSNKSMDDAFNGVIYGDVIEHWKKLAGDKQTFIYTYSVDSAKQLADEFKQAGITAEAVDGSTPSEVRNKHVSDFKANRIQVLINVELFTEGVDAGNADAVVMLRPTQSLSLYLQFAMRPLNPREGKTAIMIDHVGNAQRFGLPDADREWSLKGTKKTKREQQENTVKVRECQFCFAVMDASEVIHETVDGKRVDRCAYCGSIMSTVAENERQVISEAELVEITDKAAFERQRLAGQKYNKNNSLERNYDVAVAKSDGKKNPLYGMFAVLVNYKRATYGDDELKQFADIKELKISDVMRAYNWAQKKRKEREDQQPSWMAKNFY